MMSFIKVLDHYLPAEASAQAGELISIYTSNPTPSHT